MLRMTDLLSPESVLMDVDGVSSKRTLKLISETIERLHPDIPANDVLDGLLQRERLGTTNIGHGVALPHTKSAYTNESYAVLVKLKEGIHYDSKDEPPVDLLFTLLVPEDSSAHSIPIDEITKLFNDEEFCDALRKAQTPDSLYEAATNYGDKLAIAS